MAALVLLTVLSPVIGSACVLSAVLYRAWPLFAHDRVGRGGSRLRLVKVRTLPPTTGTYVNKYELKQVTIPRVMASMRRVHLDELPQLWHVARGQMSFVGPRPEMAHLHDRLETVFAEERLRVPPGLTGLWQISPHNAGLIGERPEYDRLYVSHRSRRLDCWILLRTLRKMTGGRTTELGELPTGLARQTPMAKPPVDEEPAALWS